MYKQRWLHGQAWPGIPREMHRTTELASLSLGPAIQLDYRQVELTFRLLVCLSLCRVEKNSTTATPSQPDATIKTETQGQYHGYCRDCVSEPNDRRIGLFTKKETTRNYRNVWEVYPELQKCLPGLPGLH
jgi:hypothetical protein